MLVRDREGGLPGKRRLPAQEFEHHDAERVQICAGIRGRTLDLLGRQILNGPRDGSLRLADMRLGIGPGQAEIGHLNRAVAGDQDVLRLHVSVDYAVSVRMVEGGENLHGDLDHLRRLEAAVP